LARNGASGLSESNIHRIVRDNIEAGRPPVEGFEAFDAFFDMEQTGRSELIHNYLRFDAFAEAYPDAKFIFNYRDVNAWIRSRLNHGRGSYFYRMSRYYDTDADGLAEIWRHQFEEHKARVETYFRDKPHRLFVFRLEEAPVEALCAFLRPAYKLKPEFWKKTRVGSATQVHAAE